MRRPDSGLALSLVYQTSLTICLFRCREIYEVHHYEQASAPFLLKPAACPGCVNWGGPPHRLVCKLTRTGSYLSAQCHPSFSDSGILFYDYHQRSWISRPRFFALEDGQDAHRRAGRFIYIWLGCRSRRVMAQSTRATTSVFRSRRGGSEPR